MNVKLNTTSSLVPVPISPSFLPKGNHHHTFCTMKFMTSKPDIKLYINVIIKYVFF